MVAVGVVESPVDNVVNMVAVLNRLVATIWSMHMPVGVCTLLAATAGVGFIDWKHMRFDFAVCLLVMELSVVQIVDMITMLYGSMTAALAMLVFVLGYI